MSYTDVAFTYTWTGFSTSSLNGITIITPGTFSAYGPAIIPGAPNNPTSYKIGTFGAATGIGPPATCPYTAPYFIGMQIVPTIAVPFGVALCSGPAPDPNPVDAARWSVDPAALTIIKSWQLTSADSVADWIPISPGLSYYVVIEAYGASLARWSHVVYSTLLTFEDLVTQYLGGPEQFVPVGTSIELDIEVSDGAGPLDIDIDWGDGTVVHNHYAHASFGTLADAYFHIEDLTPLTHAYAAVGLYEITVSGSDTNGGTATVSIPVAAVSGPTATITAPTHVALADTATVVLSGHSDAWELMAAGVPATNPDGYDRTKSVFARGPRTYWTFDVTTGSAFASDHFTSADWSGPGEPPNNPTPSSPLPNAIWFPDDTLNRSLRDAGNPAVVTLVLRDVFNTWSQQVTVTANILFRAPPQRQFPRDDGLAISTRRSWPPPTTKQFGLRRGAVSTVE